MKKILLKNHIKISRWISLIGIFSIILIQIFETTSNNLYAMILTSPELLEYTSVADSVYFFFV